MLHYKPLSPHRRFLQPKPCPLSRSRQHILLPALSLYSLRQFPPVLCRSPPAYPSDTARSVSVPAPRCIVFWHRYNLSFPMPHPLSRSPMHIFPPAALPPFLSQGSH